jgi:hypothetical protein
MYQATAPNQCPSGAALNELVETWDHLLRDVPAEQLNDLFNAALAEHVRSPRATRMAFVAGGPRWGCYRTR